MTNKDNAWIVRMIVALPIDEQYKIAYLVAENIGFRLVSEKEEEDGLERVQSTTAEPRE